MNPSDLRLAQRVYLFGRGLDIAGTQIHNALHWSDPEQFLERLDEAKHEGDGGRRFLNMVELIGAAAHGHLQPIERGQDLVNRIWANARRLMAAECAEFMVGVDLRHERWLPYKDWVRDCLHEDDVVLTFNYDTVLETLNRFSDRLAVQVPGRLGHGTGEVPVFNLHGSLRWYRVGNEAIEVRPPDTFGREEGATVVLGTPGPSKLATTQDLAELWTAACTRLASADAVVFVGYRFPPSDAFGRFELLKAIWNNQRPKLKLHVVLGMPSNDVTRMRQLLEIAKARRGRLETQIVVHDLYAEDFLGAFPRGDLLPSIRQDN